MPCLLSLIVPYEWTNSFIFSTFIVPLMLPVFCAPLFFCLLMSKPIKMTYVLKVFPL